MPDRDLEDEGKKHENKFLIALDTKFEITKKKSTISTEIMGGITTFLSMAYILATNSTIMASSHPTNPYLWNSVFIATTIASIIGTVLMGLLTNMPFAQAPGMGLNTQAVLFMVSAPYYSYGGVMAVILVSGLLFLILSLTRFREFMFRGIPPGVRSAIPVGIGLFIAFAGITNAHLVVDEDTSSLVGLVPFKEMYHDKELRLKACSGIVCLLGIIIIGVFRRFNIKGAILFGVLLSTIVAMPFGLVQFSNLKKGWDVGKRFRDFFSGQFDQGGLFGLCFLGFQNAFNKKRALASIGNIITFGMVDFFDTVGSLQGLGVYTHMVDESTGHIEHLGLLLLADCAGAVVGAVLGTSSVTTCVESGTGIAVGARTKLSSLVVAALFFLSVFLSPIFSLVPPCATAPALIYMGIMLVSTVRTMNMDDPVEVCTMMVTALLMPLSYSITDGIGIGILTYCAIGILAFLIDSFFYCCTKRIPGTPEGLNEKDNPKPEWPISLANGVLAVLFLVMFLVPTHFVEE